VERHFQAPGKLLLAGEYAVLDGAPAVVAAVDRYATVRVRPPHDASTVHIASVAGGGQPISCTVELKTGRLTGDASPVVAACMAILREELGDELDLRARPCEIEIDTGELSSAREGEGLPAKLGLGSSAAVAVCLLGALFDGRLEEDRLLRLADRAHRAAQGGVGSGADVAAAALGGLLLFWLTSPGSNPEPQTHRFADGARTGCAGVVCWTGQPASTPRLVEAVRRWRDTSPDRYNERMVEIGTAAAGMAAALQGRDAGALVESVASGFEAMTRLDECCGAGLVLDTHRRLHALATRYGGAAKPTGAGGGDVGLAVLPPTSDVSGFVKELQQRHLPVVPLRLAPRGFGMLERRAPRPTTAWLEL
jgi:phosphomevalonate kinase